MKLRQPFFASWIATSAVVCLSSGHAAILAGVDFQQGTSTVAPGFTGITAGAGKSYSTTQSGITMSFVGTSTGANANRDRNGAIDAFPLLDDFLQLVGTNVDGGRPTATITFSGLAPNTTYTVAFYSHNQGSFQQAHTFYQGTTSGTNLGTFTTTFNPSATTPNPDLATIDFDLMSDGSGVILVTMAANADRLTINGFSVSAIPEPAAVLLGSLGLLGLLRRRR